MMKSFLFAASAVLLTLAGFSATAQVALEMKLNRTIYMQYEPVFAQVKIRNYSGQPLVFGESKELKGELLFDIRSDSHSPALTPLSTTVYPLDGTILNPGQSIAVNVPLTRYYNLLKLGNYRLHAYIKHSQLNSMYKSNELKFEVNPGVVIWSKKVGVPDVLKVAGQPKEAKKERTFSLRAMVENANRYLYIVLEDDNHIYLVTRIGREIGVERCKMEVDAMSRLHIIVPISPKVFRYLIINIDGQPDQEKYLKNTAKTIPSLVLDPSNGRVHVAGGADAMPGVDYDPPLSPTPENIFGRQQ